ncbi:MAG: hypothetical protein ACK5XR_18725 [Pseudanabaena sp.]
MTKSIPEKYKKCAMLSAAQAQELHGNDGDRCWNPKVCYSLLPVHLIYFLI